MAITTQCLMFVLGGLFCLHIAGHLGLYLFPMRSIERLKSHLEDPRCGLDDCHIITVGNSHNLAAIAPHTFTDPVKHLSTPLQSLSGSLFYLTYFKKRIGQAKVVLLPVSIGMLEQDTQMRPITILNLATVDGWRWEYLRLSRDIDILIRSWAVPLARMDAWRGPFESLFCDRDTVAGQPEDPFQHDRVARHLAFLQGDDVEQSRAENVKNLYRMAEICRDLGACLVLYESPVSMAYRKSFETQRPDYCHWKDTLRRFVAKAQTGLPVYFVENLWSPEELGNAEFYKDQEHLSRAGRLHFSQRLQQHLATTLIDTRFGDLELCQTHHPRRTAAGAAREISAAVPSRQTAKDRADGLLRR